MTEFLKAVIAASWQGALVILLILLVRPVFGVWVPARWRYALWGLVLLRLLVPAFILPPSPASLQNIAAVGRPFEAAALALSKTDATEPMSIRWRSQGPDLDDIPSVRAENTIAKMPKRSWWRIAAVAWLSGAAAAGILIAVATVRLHRRVRGDSAAAEESVERVWLRCCARLSVSRPPRLLATGCVESPALIGLLRPALLIPRDARFSPEDWEHVFMHELAHFRRRDHWAQMVQLLALCAHWFNPLVWLGFRYLRADRELAADEWALRHLEGSRSVAYGDTLLKVLAAQAGAAVPRCMVGIMEDSAQMKQRLRHIVAFGPRRIVGSIAGIAVVLALAAVVLGRQLEKADLTPYEGLAPEEILVTAARNGDRPVVEKMLADGVDVNGVVATRGERTALTAAIAANRLEIARLLVDKGADANLKPEKGDAPIIVAWKKGWPECAEFLLSKGAANEPELLAAAKGDAVAIDKFLSSGSANFEKLKALCEIAAANGHAAIFASLCDAIRALPDQWRWEPGRGMAAIAVARGHRTVVEEMIKRGEQLNKGGVIRLAPLMADSPEMREWLVSKGFTVPEYNDGERLIEAAERENLPEIRRLIAAGADVNCRGESDWTPLSKAATWGNPKAVKLLLEFRAEPNPRKHHYNTLSLAKTPEIADLLIGAGAKVKPDDIHYCLSHGSIEMVRWFLNHGLDPLKVKNDEEGTLLFDAGEPEVAGLLIARGVDINARNKFGHTAMIWNLQMRENAAEIVAVLLKHGADPNERGQGGSTPLMSAQDGAAVDVLLAAGADLHATDDRGNGVLYSGWGASIPSRIEALRRHGLKLDPVKGGSLLVSAILLRRDLGAVKALLAMGIDPNAPDSWEGRPSGTPLAAALANGAFEIADVLRAAGAKDVGSLSEAAARGDLARMTALLDAGADVDEVSGAGKTPLHYAIFQGRTAAVHLLLERGANVSRFDNMGNTAYSKASLLLGQIDYNGFTQLPDMDLPKARKTLEEIMAAIRTHKPDPNWRNEAGETVLMCAAQVGSTSPLNLPPGEKVDINAQRPDGMTAQMLAIVSQPKNAPREGPGSVGITEKKGGATQWMSARAHVVKTLLENGADLSLRNKAGKTALDLAMENGNEEILALLNAAKR